MEEDKLVRITIKNGHAEVVHAPDGIQVEIANYDKGEENPECAIFAFSGKRDKKLP